MKFVPDAVLEARASEIWRNHSLEVGFDAEALLDHLGIGLVWDEVADEPTARILGQLEAATPLVVLNEAHKEDLEARHGALRRYTIGHELGHWVLHAGAIRSGTLSLLNRGRTWCRDGSRDPAEVQAEKFAATLLMPRDLLRSELPTGSWSGWGPVYRLAERFVVTPTAMIVRLKELRWAHLDETRIPLSGPEPIAGQGRLQFG